MSHCSLRACQRLSALSLKVLAEEKHKGRKAEKDAGQHREWKGLSSAVDTGPPPTARGILGSAPAGRQLSSEGGRTAEARCLVGAEGLLLRGRTVSEDTYGGVL